MNASTSEKALYWAQSTHFDEKTRKEIQTLLDQGQTQEWQDRFYRDLEFGTGGLRGVMGAGTNRMNVYNIRRATHALALNLKNQYFGPLSVAIAYDSRVSSREFAFQAAQILAAHGITSYVTDRMRATPILSFMVRHFGCQGGICITASHNPPEYNGYKAYNHQGGQVVSPQDRDILEIYQQTSYQTLSEFDQFDQKMIKKVGDDVDQAYFEAIKKAISFYPLPKDQSFSILYSPLGGAGAETMGRALALFGFHDVSLVEKDCVFDGSFQGIQSSNPEEQKAYHNALSQSKKEHRVIFTTDPDCDRFGMMVRQTPDTLEWSWFTGHQLASLLTYFVLLSHKRLGTMPKNPLIVKTVVTTDLVRQIGDSFGVLCEETLTGFKWICDLVERLKGERSFVCGGEESYGFLAGHHARDKDGMVGSCLAAQMIAYFEQVEKKTLSQVLDELYDRFGYYQEELKNYVFKGESGMEAMAQIMAKVKELPFLTIGDEEVVMRVDYEQQVVQSRQKSLWTTVGETKLPSSLGMQFRLSSGGKISVRPSGTEPKLKVYVSLVGDKTQRELLTSRIEGMIKDLSVKLSLPSMELT